MHFMGFGSIFKAESIRAGHNMPPPPNTRGCADDVKNLLFTRLCIPRSLQKLENGSAEENL